VEVLVVEIEVEIAVARSGLEIKMVKNLAVVIVNAMEVLGKRTDEILAAKEVAVAANHLYLAKVTLLISLPLILAQMTFPPHLLKCFVVVGPLLTQVHTLQQSFALTFCVENLLFLLEKTKASTSITSSVY
jgi:hypothetical protein